MTHPNRDMSFQPFQILRASEMNDLVENIEAHHEWITNGPRFKIGHFTIGDTAGQYSNTTVGFKPQGIQFFYRGSDGTRAEDMTGGIDGTGNQFCVVSLATATDRYTRSNSNVCMRILFNNGDNALIASYVSLDATGFTLNVTLTDGVPRNFAYVAFG